MNSISLSKYICELKVQANKEDDLLVKPKFGTIFVSVVSKKAS